MAFEEIGRVAISSQCLGYLNAFAGNRSFRRRPFQRLEFLAVDVTHSFLLLKAVDRKRRFVTPPSSKLQTFSASTSMQPLSFCNVPSTMRVDEVRIGRRNVS